MAYLRIMGDELGYIKGNELKSIADTAMMYAEIVMKMIPSKVLFYTPVTILLKYKLLFLCHSEIALTLTVHHFY